MEILQKQKVTPRNVEPGDTVALFYGEQEMMRREIGRTMTIDEIVIFNLDSGDIEGVKDGIGGAFLESTTHASPNKLP